MWHCPNPFRTGCGRRSAFCFRPAERTRPAPADDCSSPRLPGDSAMMRLAMSAAAIGLRRALVARSGIESDRILLMEWTSRDWQSLTFIGERHEARIRVCGPDAPEVTQRILTGLEDAEFNIPGHIVAD